MALPRSPLLSVDSITYVDTDGVTQTLASTYYVVDTGCEPGRVLLAYDQDWPEVRDDINQVFINFKAGYAVPFTANATTNVVTFQGRNPVANECIRLSNSGGTLPAGLSALTDYYAVNVSGATCKLALTSGGSAVDITGVGTGTHFAGVIPPSILAAIRAYTSEMYEHRGPNSEFALHENRNYDRMLNGSRVWEM